jgi:hypothetical protein
MGYTRYYMSITLLLLREMEMVDEVKITLTEMEDQVKRINVDSQQRVSTNPKTRPSQKKF